MYRALKVGVIPGSAKYLGFLAIFIAILGEFVNDGSRYPYIVVLDSEGIGIKAFFNYYISMAAIFPAVIAILLFLLAGLAIFMLAAYYAVVRRFIV